MVIFNMVSNNKKILKWAGEGKKHQKQIGNFFYPVSNNYLPSFQTYFKLNTPILSGFNREFMHIFIRKIGTFYKKLKISKKISK